MAALDRHHQVQALAAGGAREALQTELPQPLPQLVRRRDHPRERQALGRVEVEHQPVRALGPVGAGAVRVQLDGAELDQGQQALGVVDGEDTAPCRRGRPPGTVRIAAGMPAARWRW